MTNLSFCLKRMAPHIDEKFMSDTKPGQVLGIKILDENFKPSELSAEYVYIGELSNVMRAAVSYDNDGVITMISAKAEDRAIFLPVKMVNLVAMDYTLSELFNNLNAILEVYSAWDRIITDTLYKGEGINGLISRCGEFLEAQVMLFNTGYHLLAGSFSDRFTSHFSSEVCLAEYLCYDTVIKLEQRMAECEDGEKENYYHFMPSDEDTQVFVRHIYIDGVAAATLMVIMQAVPDQYDMFYLTNQLASVIKSLAGSRAAGIDVGSNKLGALVSDIHKKRHLSTLEITDRLSNLEYKLRNYVRCININFNDDDYDPPYEEVLRKVSFLFGQCNTALYKNSILVIYSDDAKTHQLPDVLCNEDFNNLLEEYHAVAVVSGSFRHYDKFESVYLLCRRLGRILRKMTFPNIYGRVYPFDEFAIYVSIDLAAKQFADSLGSTDIVLLADPAIITLYRYDKEHNSNLCDVLLNYLSHGRSVSETAKALFMHRNTVQNKIAKISSLTWLDLSDGNVQQRMLYSCQIVKYYTEYLGQTLI
ncbi:MAG: helix-turn-helix domain-containing protein [Lachnospiraceae bacterium]|nr:helix-turn-helix domain-containing protein [Lachnospiraceae bacterium]